MEVDLLDFVEQCRRLVKQALGKHAGEPASGGFARWKHVVLHCFRLEDGHSYRETPNRLKYMSEVRNVLGLDRDDLPYRLQHDLQIVRSAENPVWSGAAARFRAAAPAVWPRRSRQHVLRSATCVVVLSPASRTDDTNPKSDDID